MAGRTKKRKNAGAGYGYMFHGAFKDKKDAVAKEKKTKGAWIKGTLTNRGHRYLVMSPRTNPIKRKKKEKLPVDLGTAETFDRGTPVIREKVKVYDPRTGKWRTKTIKRNPHEIAKASCDGAAPVALWNADRWELTTAEIESALAKIRILRSRATKELSWKQST
jgi:hypothetical protein